MTAPAAPCTLDAMRLSVTRILLDLAARERARLERAAAMAARAQTAEEIRAIIDAAAAGGKR